MYRIYQNLGNIYCRCFRKYLKIYIYIYKKLIRFAKVSIGCKRT